MEVGFGIYLDAELTDWIQGVFQFYTCYITNQPLTLGGLQQPQSAFAPLSVTGRPLQEGSSAPRDIGWGGLTGAAGATSKRASQQVCDSDRAQPGLAAEVFVLFTRAAPGAPWASQNVAAG